MKGQGINWFSRDDVVKYLFLIPLILLLLLLLGYPAIYDLVSSFLDVRLGNLDFSSFCGFENYTNVLSAEEFWQALGFSFRFSLQVLILEIILGITIALFFNRFFQENKWLLSLVLLPMMTAPALLGIMFRLLLNDFVGTAPQYLNMIGLGGISLLSHDYIIPTIIMIDVIQWTPFVFLLVYSAIQTIPMEIMEAAAVDGCNSRQRLFKIVFPFITPYIITVGFFRFIDSFRIYDQIYVLTGGGPGNLTTGISIYIYKLAFSYGNLGESITASLFLLLLSFIPLLISIKFIFKGGE